MSQDDRDAETLEEWRASQEWWEWAPQFRANLETKATEHGWPWVRDNYTMILAHWRLYVQQLTLEVYLSFGGRPEDV